MIHFADLTYSEEDMEQDAIEYLKTQIYKPAYADKVKDFLQDDTVDFKRYYDDAEYGFLSIYYDEYVKDYYEKDDMVVPRFDFHRLSQEMEDDFGMLGMGAGDVKKYALIAEAEFRKNAYRSHSEPYFIKTDAVAVLSVNGYSRDPLYSIYSMVREWAMAMHLKKMYPVLMRRFGYLYQEIRENYSGEKRLQKLLNFKSKYKLTIDSVSMIRTVHSSVFAYMYLYLKAYLTQETAEIEEFILDNASEPVELLLQGDTVTNVDFQVVRFALKLLKNGAIKGILRQDGSIDWNSLYEFSMEAIKNYVGAGNIRSVCGFDGIDARAIQSFWNKSANMQQMLKILRRLSMDNSDPIFQQLIQMCEYRLGRPDKKKKKMERFIEKTREYMARQAYEITRPRTMAQEMLAAFPSVFLVYFQWHHSFRTIYPKVSESQIYYENQKKKNLQAEDSLKMQIRQEDLQRANTRQQEENQRQTRIADDDRLRMVIQDEITKKNELAEQQKQQQQNQNQQANQGYERGSR
ncbi:MAG: hypothetical protein MJ212_03015 [Alphaproteobacteria bacterium]|nr:hypothetical protein [Alphaproteobacteria bacterium]